MLALHLRSAIAPALAVAALAAVGPADNLVTKDGRVIQVKKAREEGASYKLVFAAGEIVVPKAQVASVEIEGDMSDYVPKDDKEKEFLAKGYVRHKGKWISKAGYEVELAKATEVRRKRTEELKKRSKFGTGWEVESKHFHFKSNTSPEILQHYVDLIEAYYDLMDSRIGIKPSPTLARTKMQINVYRRQKEMIDEAGDKDIDESILGYFSPSNQTLNFFHDYKDPARSQVTALHECTHLLTFLVDPDYLAQIWINEAVADYFGSCNVTSAKGKLALAPGRLEEDSILTVQQAITEKKQLSLERLFMTEREEYDGFYYAHGWSFVYFVQNSPKYAKPFTKFFKDLYGLDLKEAKAEVLATGFSDKSGLRKRYAAGDIRDALVKRLGVKDLATLEKEWLEFIAATPIEGPRARFLRGYARALSGEESKLALEDLEAAIAGGYTGPEVYWARAYARLSTDGIEGAVEDFRKASELDPLDAVYRADLAWGLTGWWAEAKEIGGDEPAQAEALVQLGLAVELDPENDEWAQLLEGYVAQRGKK
jgi:hypothetical protein